MRLDSMHEELLAFLKSHEYSGYLLVTDRRVFALYGQLVIRTLQKLEKPISVYQCEGGESAKTIASAEKCWEQMHAQGLDRSCLVIALGGGVVTDLAGFIASCYMRGVDSIYIPTTLLGMVDAAIGGKTGVNLPTGKNIVGSFHPPIHVFNDISFLKTLPKKEFQSGIAESIKCGVIGDLPLFEYLEQHMAELLDYNPEVLTKIIKDTGQFKKNIVERDLTEKGIRVHLNYGHTFAHAIETATDYNTYLHGEAVSIGMCLAAQTSQQLGWVDEQFVKRQETLCKMAGLPTSMPTSIPPKKFIELMRGDKKSIVGQIVLILPLAIGKVKVCHLTADKLSHLMNDNKK